MALAAPHLGLRIWPELRGPGIAFATLGLALVAGGVLTGSAGARRGVRSWWSRPLAPPLPWAEVLRAAAWFGLCTGLIEVSVLAVRKFAFREMPGLSPDVAWMTPLAYGVVFLALAAIVRLAAGGWNRLGSPRAFSFGLSFLGWWSVLLAVPRIHRAALAVLAAGLAAQTARIIVAHRRGFAALCRRTLSWMAGTVAVLAVVVIGWPILAERRAEARLPKAAPGLPNVILIVIDTVRAGNLSLHGYHRTTSPFLRGWARAGIIFDQAFTTAPWTVPAHGTLFTGRYPHELSADWTVPLDDAEPTLAGVLSEHGYATAGFTGNLICGTRERGFDRGFTHFEDFHPSFRLAATSFQLGSWAVSAGWAGGPLDVRKTAPEVTEEFVNWLPRAGGRPFFAFLNYFDAHALYLPPAPFNTQFGPPGEVLFHGLWIQPSAGELKVLTDAYDGCLAFVDHELGVLHGYLQRHGLLDNTLVVIVSDHGEHLGEHGLLDHGNSLYDPVLHVPLVLSYPGRWPQGLRVTEPVTLRDVPATVLAALGIGGRLPGTSLERTWNPSAANGPPSPLLSEVSAGINTPPWFPNSRGPLKSLAAEGFRLIRSGDGAEELYSIQDDPQEARNLIGDPGCSALADRLRAALDAALR